MKISDVLLHLESLAPSSLQEQYDNAGLLTGNPSWDCTGILVSLDVTEEVIEEAVSKKCNLIVAHHPIIFKGLKRITGKNYVERTIIKAIKNDIGIFAIHTNLDNIAEGVNGKIASLLDLQHCTVLSAKENMLKKLFTFVPVDKAEQVRTALFEAGAGHIGNYSECSFGTEGTGTFTAGAGTNPYTGKHGVRHSEREMKIEMIFPSFLENNMIRALKASHPYEEAAYDLVPLSNSHNGIGSGLTGELSDPMDEKTFLSQLKSVFKLQVIRHTPLLNKPIRRVAVCGGAGSFLISKALASGADAYVTADIKYHEFFDADGKMLLTDIGHYESEQFTIDLLQGILEQKFPTFAVLKTEIKTNPVHYF